MARPKKQVETPGEDGAPEQLDDLIGHSDNINAQDEGQQPADPETAEPTDAALVARYALGVPADVIRSSGDVEQLRER